MNLRVSAPTAPAPKPELTPISKIQGTGDVSPMVDKPVSIEGIVVADRRYTDRKGVEQQILIVQEPKGDGKATTSDALAVRPPSVVDARLGQQLLATGVVAEHGSMTGIDDAAVTLGEVGELPKPVMLNLPNDAVKAQAYLEAREGMVVSFPDAIVMGPTQSYLEFTARDAKRGTARNHDQKDLGSHLAVKTSEQFPVEAGTGDRVHGIRGVIEDSRNGKALYLDSEVEHIAGPPAPKLWGDIDGDGKIAAADVEAITERVGEPSTGPLDPADLDNDGTISASDAKAAAARGERLLLGKDGYSVVSVNAENLFDTVDNPRKRDTVLSKADLAAKVASLGKLISGELGAPAVVAMQEVENDTVLDQLVKSPAMKDLGYDYRIVEGPDGRGINVALLFRAGQGVTVQDVRTAQSDDVPPIDPKLREAAGKKGGFDPKKGDQQLFARPPLVVDLTVPAPDGGADEQLSVIVNHFMSKFSPDGLPTEPWRLKQGEFVRDLAAQMRKDTPGRQVMIVGDLNDNESSEMITRIGKGGTLENVAAAHVPKAERYSYVFKGSAEQLDHVFATKELAERVAYSRVHHVHADSPAAGSDRPTDHDVIETRIAFAPKV